MTDGRSLVEMLRNSTARAGALGYYVELMQEAADEIERLRNIVIGLNAALDDYWNGGDTDGHVKNICDWQLKTKEVLAFPNGASEGQP
jgi:hypothetical protein